MNFYAPILKNVLFPFYEGVIKNRDTIHELNVYEKNLFATTQQLKKIQLNRLHALLNHCNNSVPYYQRLFKEIGIDSISNDIKTLTDFQNIPVLTKDQIRANNDDLISLEFKGKNLSKSTGGSTGAPLRLELNPESEFSRTAVMYRGYGWLGAGLGVKAFFLWGANLGHNSILKKVKHSLHESFLNRKTVSSFNMRQDNLVDYIEQINKYKPTALVSYTNPLFQLAKFIIEHKVSVYQPKTIITGAEALSDYQREIIEKAFRCKVYNTYGCREVMLIGAECKKQKGFHLNIDHLVVETLDNDHKNVSGKVGDIHLTDLSNYGMPLLRYQNGDTGILTNRACDCCNPLPLLEEVSGRKVDVLKTPSGGLIPGVFFPHIMKEHDEIIKYQIKQSTMSTIDLNIIASGELKKSSAKAIQSEFSKIANDITLKIKVVDDIPLSPSGKHRNVICEI